MERSKTVLGGSLLALALGLLALGCSGSRPPATSPDERPQPDSRRQAHPAERLDGGGATPPASRARPGDDGGFDRGVVREESLSDAHDKNAPDKKARDRKAEDAEAADDHEGTDADRDAVSRDERDSEEHGAPADLHHILQRGQTLYSVSRMYGVSLDALLRANGIRDARKVAAGTSLLIPLKVPERTASTAPHGDRHKGGNDAESSPAVRKAKRPEFEWPIEGAITGPFGPRGKHSHHEGIDIDGSDGDRIRAAASGTVAFAGSNGDYGRTVIIDHGDGLRTLYGHASKLLVKEGDEVHAGDVIAAVGHSGNARGSHLHFEVRRDGRPVNPLPYLLPTDVLTAGAVSLPPHTTRPASRRH
jgi:murein DD-endopeptidase MepM/ murein hydrolase activator NlpD